MWAEWEDEQKATRRKRRPPDSLLHPRCSRYIHCLSRNMIASSHCTVVRFCIAYAQRVQPPLLLSPPPALSFLSHSTDDACNSLEEHKSIFPSLSPSFSACHVSPFAFSLPTDFSVQGTIASLFATSWTKLNISGR